MKTRFLAAILLILFTANAFAESANSPSSQTERTSLITAKRVAIGTVMTIAATLVGYYHFAKPELRILGSRGARNVLVGAASTAAALPQQVLPQQQPPLDFAKTMPLLTMPILSNQLERQAQGQILLDHSADRDQEPTSIEDAKAVRQRLQPQQSLLDYEADVREATELSLAIANSLKEQESRSIREEPVIIEEIVHEKEPINKPEEKKKRVRPNIYLMTNNLCVFLRIDDPNFKRCTAETIEIFGEPYHLINSNSDLTNLNTNHAFFDPTEVIVMNSDTQMLLNAIYHEMLFHYRERFVNAPTQKQFFAFLIEFIRTQVFDADKPEKNKAVNEFLQSLSSNENILKIKKDQNQAMPIVNLLHHLKARVGVCRHYSLVLTYLVQRFIRESDSCLSGGSVHISAAKVAEDAHVWDVYVDNTGHAGFHVDALWDLNLPVSLDAQEPLDISQIERLLAADRKQFLEDSVNLTQINTNANAISDSEPHWGTQAGIFHFSISDEDEVKEDPHTPEWMSGSLDLGDIQFSS